MRRAQIAHVMPPIDPTLLRVTERGVSLLAGRKSDGRLVYPLSEADSDCPLEELPRKGTLWSWTVQRFRPKSPPYAGPEAFEPYAVGYVDLGEIIVEGRISGPWDELRIGMPMVLVAESFRLEDGEVATFAFSPDGDRG